MNVRSSLLGILRIANQYLDEAVNAFLVIAVKLSSRVQTVSATAFGILGYGTKLALMPGKRSFAGHPMRPNTGNVSSNQKAKAESLPVIIATPMKTRMSPAAI